jgi:hypothetical protein
MDESFQPRSEGSAPLSERERRILAGIEADLCRADHRLSERVTRTPGGSVWSGPAGSPVVVLSAAVLLVAALGVLLPAAAWAATVLFTALVGVPWMIWRARS